MAYRKKKNLLGDTDIYNRYYGDFRGVDFSSDHTQVHDGRLAYAVNMYRDYGAGQGKALETIPGFRRRAELPEESEIYGIHHFKSKDGVTRVLIHSGNKLYLWHNYPNTVNVTVKEAVTLPAESETVNGTRIFRLTLGDNVAAVSSASTSDGEDITLNIEYSAQTRALTVSRSDLAQGDTLEISYIEGALGASDALFHDMNTRRSTSFVFYDRLYIIDGKNYLVYDGERVSNASDNAYIPTTYINIIPSGENADVGTEYEQRNILQPKFKHTFIADGTSKEFCLNENELDGITEVKVYGEALAESEYTVDTEGGRVTLATAPKKPEDAGYPELFAGIEITASKRIVSISGIVDDDENVGGLITGCTIATIFDNRVFLSGNPHYPNHVFYCGRSSTGYVDPTYFGVLNFVQDGVGSTHITGMVAVADTLAVIKGDTQQDGSIFFHTPTDTGDHLAPRIYPSSQGLNGIGCLGACVNFLDDPVFVSRLGLEGIGQLSVRYERAIEHRSSLVDAKLVNMDLRAAVLEEWNGYLLLLVDGKIFMADSRQIYTHDIGTPQYEWYYLENIGIYKDQYPEYRYADHMHEELEGIELEYCTKCHRSAKDCSCEGGGDVIKIPLILADEVYDAELDETNSLCGEAVNPPDEDGQATARVFYDIVKGEFGGVGYQIGIYYTVKATRSNMLAPIEYRAYLCNKKGGYTGGSFNRAVLLKTLDDNVFFGTENGVVCSFNFDKRDEYGEIAPKYYTFDDRAILCGCATKMDSCGIPHLTKTTIKKSTVIKTKSMQTSAVKIKVRTNKKPYAQLARINSSVFSFDNMDFSDFTFNTQEQSLFCVREKEKKWVEKQYYMYSDEYMKPFALYYVCFRYKIAGRYKER